MRRLLVWPRGMALCAGCTAILLLLSGCGDDEPRDIPCTDFVELSDDEQQSIASAWPEVIDGRLTAAEQAAHLVSFCESDLEGNFIKTG